MNHVLNDNGNSTSNSSGHLKPAATKTQFGGSTPETTETEVAFRTADGTVLSGVPLRIERHLLVFELFNPLTSPQFSEALEE